MAAIQCAHSGVHVSSALGKLGWAEVILLFHRQAKIRQDPTKGIWQAQTQGLKSKSWCSFSGTATNPQVSIFIATSLSLQIQTRVDMEKW